MAQTLIFRFTVATLCIGGFFLFNECLFWHRRQENRDGYYTERSRIVGHTERAIVI